MGCSAIGVTLAIVSACNYAPGRSVAAGDGPDDGAIDTPLVDASLCFAGFTAGCLAALPDEPLNITDDTAIDTNGVSCVATTTASTLGICVVAATTILIENGARLSALGDKPLLLLATTGAIQVKGTLDVSSHIGGALGAGYSPTPCTQGTLPTDANNSGGGGYGGTFGAAGGNGGPSVGRGAAGIAVLATAEPATLRGGCPGSAGARQNAGAGGAGGGAVELTAPSIQISGAVIASGAGGGGGANNDAGGGGGGSGGMIAFSTPTLTFVLAGSAFAQGGGGGGGAGGDGAAFPGMDPSVAGVAAPSGDGFHDAGGTLGAGGVGSTTAAGGLAQDGNLIGGGGGGGGSGVIKTTGTVTGGTIAPPPS